MFKQLFNYFRSIACLALLALGAGLPLITTHAHAGSIPLAGESFYEAEGTLYSGIALLPGWSWHRDSIYYNKVFMTSNPADNALGIYDYVSVICALHCDPSDPNYLSKRIDGLVTGHQYKLTFWAKGYWQNDAGEGFPDSYTYGNTKVSASLGSFKSAAIEILNGLAWNWQKIALNFTYKDASPSAMLSIIQNIVGPMTIGCAPCGTTLWFGGISLDDVTPAGPTLTVTKALSGNRAANTDQFTVQILEGIKVVNSTTNSTTTGTGATINSGSGTTGATTLVAGTSYVISEVASGTTNLGRYTSTLSCTNSTGTTVPIALNTAFTLSNSDTVSCTITNKTRAATLTLRQQVVDPLPVNIVAPFTFTWTADNGWGTRTLTNLVVNNFVSSAALPLSAFNTATNVSVTLPTTRWGVASIRCIDANAGVSGNPAGTLVEVLEATSATIPASYVRPGASLRCTGTLKHSTP